MDALQLIGAVGAAVLKRRLDTGPEQDGTARFMLDRLTGAQVAAIVRAVLADRDVSGKVSIRIPRELVASHDLPDGVLTDERTVNLRHTVWDTPALLIANTEDDQGTSLQDITRLGAKLLTEEPALWVAAASADLNLPEENIGTWGTALAGLNAADDWSLQQMANYVSLTRTCVMEESRPLLDALGWALPALQMPRDSGFFRAVRDLGSKAKWRKLFQKLLTERSPLLMKERRPGQIIEAEELRAHWENVRDALQPAVHPVVEAFIASPPGWRPEAAQLAYCEYEEDGIFQLFSGLRLKKITLAEETLEFFDLNMPKRLADAEKDYLEQLKRVKVRVGREEDLDFFEAHRDDLGQDRSLRAKWEKFVFGKAIECVDLLSGLLLAIERLYGQTSNSGGPRTLEIRSARQTKRHWLELNADIGMAFCARYRGLPQLMGPNVIWEVSHLFQYDELLTEAAKRKKYHRNESMARASLQIKFDITLRVVQGAATERNTVQVIWTGDPRAVGLELAGDLQRLEERPLMVSTVARQSVSRKGALQSVSLFDVTTIEPAFGKDSGSLVSKLTPKTDLGRKFPEAVKKAVGDNRLTKAAAAELTKAWTTFVDAYGAAVKAWRGEGLASDLFIQQAAAYGGLLKTVGTVAPGDVNRQELLQPLLGIGCVAVTGGSPTAIVAPWQPMRMMAVAIKARAVAGLIRHVLTAEEVNFGDRRLFFSDLRSELAHPWYPEVAVGYIGGEPVLLAETGTVNDYSLMERPVGDPNETATDVDPREAAQQIRQLISRYLELQPHEASNLSIVLYNCDAAGLPLEAVNSLAALSDNGEIHCNVLVRHRDRTKLNRVYGELLERAEADPDAIVVSEASRNFMSKLRIGVMLDSGNGEGGKSREVDVAFLHDVVSRHAREAWIDVTYPAPPVDVAEHVPARWSYRRVSAEDELKATSFLACPRQPQQGWEYLEAVAAVVRQQAHPTGHCMLPARQISFEDQHLRSMFKEVHGTAEWVATYDELLDKRQLRAQGVQVIRYRRQRTHGRNIVVSSTAELRMLGVLIRKRFNELNLGLPEDRTAGLAQRMIDDALMVSGDIVLRAAKRGVSAGELIGLVLSRALVAEELEASSTTAWFLLDDYAEWLGQREEGIADILGLSVEPREAGTYRLRVVVTEAKYVAADGSAEARRGSQKQLRETVLRMENALFGDPGRLDRDLWLSRIADLLLDGTTPVGQSGILERVRDGIRRGAVPIDLRGYSHVFVSNPADGGGVASGQERLDDIKNGLQEVFSRADLRALLLAYEAGEPLRTVRDRVGDERPWQRSDFREPAARVSWTVRPGEASVGTGASAPIAQQQAVMPQAEAPEREARREAGAAPREEEGPDKALTEATRLMSLVATKASQQQAASAPEEEWLKATEQKLRTALLGYNLQAKVTGNSRLTPNAALIRFVGSDRLRVEDIEAKRSALLTTHGLRVVGILGLPREIVVSVERPQRQTVSLWDAWARRELNVNAVGINTSFVLGLKELDGNILYLNLGSAFGGEGAHEPHTLIAGATGSGKSVLIQALILDIAATNPPSLARIHLIDPKMGVDYAALERLPHLQDGIVVRQAEAVQVLEGLVAEMDRRYELFRGKARDLKTFNQKVPPPERLPVVYLVHDEFAEWMMTDTYRDAVAATVQRLGVKARAAGIHLFFAAQRPDANVMPVQLRDNLGNRLILKVASVGTSEIALGTKGAESLLGLGHLAARLGGQMVFAQAPFLSDEDIETAVEAIRAAEEPPAS
jgi:DNA segregation ATPase FtsK/SpoIIIE, S-DNA-T family